MQERRRLVDLYQAGLIELVELQRRAKDIDVRHAGVVTERDWLAAQRAELASDNLLRQRVSYFARRTLAALDALDFDQRQKLLRLVIEQVLVTGSHIEIRYPSLSTRYPTNQPRPTAPAPGRQAICACAPLVTTNGERRCWLSDWAHVPP